jgi:hypothetical protein
MNRATLAALAIATLVLPAQSATIHVPADQPTIQAGIDAAAPGDTVEVACGTYYESRIWLRQGRVIRSSNGDPTCVTVDAQQLDRVFACENVGSALPVTLEGITVTGGLADGVGLDVFGGGLFCQHISLTLTRCVFVGNVAEGGGGAFCDLDTDPTITDCWFVTNTATSGGGGLYLSNATALVERCVFAYNAAFAGGAILDGASYSTIRQCTLVENRADWIGGGVLVQGTPGFGLTTLDRTIVASSAAGGGVVDEDEEGLVAIACSDLHGNAGGDWVGCIASQNGVNGNFSASPLFCDPASGDFQIRSDSPCAPANSGGCGLIGALDVGCGPVSLTLETWARIKAGYR